jgi:hypothetical protein
MLTRNPDYFDKGYPYINECRILSTPDATTHLAAFRTGQSDILVLQSLSDVETLRKTNSTAVVEELANVLAPLAWTVRIGTTNRRPSAEAISPPTHAGALGGDPARSLPPDLAPSASAGGLSCPRSWPARRGRARAFPAPPACYRARWLPGHARTQPASLGGASRAVDCSRSPWR